MKSDGICLSPFDLDEGLISREGKGKDKTRNLGHRILPEGTEVLESDGDASEERRN